MHRSRWSMWLWQQEEMIGESCAWRRRFGGTAVEEEGEDGEEGCWRRVRWLMVECRWCGACGEGGQEQAKGWGPWGIGRWRSM
ncbi:hypothetical protein CRG98_032374 [Punica granatum]|uniref:Uncharacterized protein n=1 Tax=Punica granatum TaxID=22663 RepID=A0A2I0ITA5_PUNGR|nr:hypothetical protein CRG98_032374 [Punica granatum]